MGMPPVYIYARQMWLIDANVVSMRGSPWTRPSGKKRLKTTFFHFRTKACRKIYYVVAIEFPIYKYTRYGARERCLLTGPAGS